MEGDSILRHCLGIRDGMGMWNIESRESGSGSISTGRMENGGKKDIILVNSGYISSHERCPDYLGRPSILARKIHSPHGLTGSPPVLETPLFSAPKCSAPPLRRRLIGAIHLYQPVQR